MLMGSGSGHIGNLKNNYIADLRIYWDGGCAHPRNNLEGAENASHMHF
jgi:hypothetical protein